MRFKAYCHRSRCSHYFFPQGCFRYISQRLIFLFFREFLQGLLCSLSEGSIFGSCQDPFWRYRHWLEGWRSYLGHFCGPHLPRSGFLLVVVARFWVAEGPLLRVFVKTCQYWLRFWHRLWFLAESDLYLDQLPIFICCSSSVFCVSLQDGVGLLYYFLQQLEMGLDLDMGPWCMWLCHSVSLIVHLFS